MQVNERSVGCSTFANHGHDSSAQGSFFLGVDWPLIPRPSPDPKVGCPVRCQCQQCFVENVEGAAGAEIAVEHYLTVEVCFAKLWCHGSGLMYHGSGLIITSPDWTQLYN